MIAVIADDFTGAAELAGISLRYGLDVKLYTGRAAYEASDICIVSSDSRSMSRNDAIEITRRIVTALQELTPSFIYKKIDSVLRGYVLDELKAQMQLTKKSKAIIVPANPSLERTIINGHYYIQHKLISQTGFFNDPEFPVRSSDVKEMLGDKDNTVAVLYRNTPVNDKAIVLAETATIQDLAYWVKETNSQWLLAGAGDLFESIVAAEFLTRAKEYPAQDSPHLYVCGTADKKSREFVDLVDQGSDCVVYLSEEQLLHPSPVFSTGQLNNIKDLVIKNDRLLLAMDGILRIPALQLRGIMAGIVQQLCELIGFREIFIEGGSTAAAILNRMGLHSFSVVNEIQRGVVRMKTEQFFITVKPGSYAIPDEIRDLYLTKDNQ